MKTIEIEITKTQKTKEIISLTVPCYWKTGKVYCALTEMSRGIVARTQESCEELSTFSFPQVYFTGDSEIITKEEFNEQFNKVINHLKSIL